MEVGIVEVAVDIAEVEVGIVDTAVDIVEVEVVLWKWQ